MWRAVPVGSAPQLRNLECFARAEGRSRRGDTTPVARWEALRRGRVGGTVFEVAANREVDDYVERSDRWSAELAALRPVLLDCGLTEEIKWNKPCYRYDGSNIAILQEMKGFLALMFFKGALLNDPAGVLEMQGPNSRSARRIRFTSIDDVARLAGTVRAYVDEAIEMDKAGMEVVPAVDLELVEELRNRLELDAALRAAFEALTPGRRREYHLYISGAKQAPTRVARVEKCVPMILAGKGFRDR